MASAERLPRTRNGNPKLKATYDVLEYWAERIDLVAPENESFEYSSMICRGDSLFHYGTHFELARILRDKRGRTRLVLLNGDSFGGSGGFGPSTSSRQMDTRRTVAHKNVPNMTVPFSALDAAGIDYTTVQPIHVRDDRTTIEEHSSRQRPAELAWMDDPSGATKPAKRWKYDVSEGHREVEIQVPVQVRNPNQTTSFSAQHGWATGGATRDENGVWHWTVRRHWLGDSIFRARAQESRTRKPTADEQADHDAHVAWTTEHERLRSVERELRHHSFQIDDRYGYGGDYRRMTRSMFAAQGFHEMAERAERVVNEHRNSQAYPIGMTRGGRMPVTVNRWATFLSSFDYQERMPLYFLCELPHGAKPNTVDEAIETLKPPEVVAAEARSLNVIRQGDLFAIPTKLSKRQLRRLARTDFTKRLRVLGTNHSVTEGVVCKGGAVLGRGIMRHEPEAWRRPDHRSQKLGDGKTWHLLVRNTVPQSK